jgi:hypothetical protein
VNHNVVVVILMVICVLVIGCGIAGIVAGIKQLRDHHRGAVQSRSSIFWLYVAIGALVFSGAMIFAFGR